MPKNFISINDFSREQIFDEILEGCDQRVDFVNMRKPNIRRPDVKVVFAFFEPSTRTLGSYYEASRLLGFDSDSIVGAEATSLMKKESFANTARMFALYNADIIVMRTKIEGAQRFISEILEEEGYNISVQNGGDGTNQHPTQTFLDLLTIKRNLGRMDNIKIGFFGDLKYGRTVHSLTTALSMRENISVVLASDPETALQEQYKRKFTNIEEGDSLELLNDCDVIYGSRLQEERFAGDPIALQRARGRFKITRKILNSFKKGVIVMHPLPYTVEITPEVRRDKRMVIDMQAGLGVPTRVCLLDDGYNCRCLKTVQSKESGKLKLIKQISLEKYLQERKKSQKVYQYFVPINNGTVIDHIPNGLGSKIGGFISDLLGKNCVKHFIYDIKSRKFGHKDTIVLEGGFLTKEQMLAVCSLSLSITMNVIQEGTFAKLRIDSPASISEIGRCPNENCITNHDPEAKSKFIPEGEGIKCCYCEKNFSAMEVLK